MRYAHEDLAYIADQTGYDCHLCHQPIKFEEYGNHSHAEGWEVDHVRPRSKNGHNGFTNLRAAHAHCNRKKGNKPNRKIRSYFGVKGMPPSTTSRVLKGAGYVLLGIGAIWALNEIFKPKPGVHQPRLNSN